MEYGVLFDVDGVLVDSYEAHFLGWKQLFDEHHKPYSKELFVAGFGMTTREVLKLQWGEPLTDDQVRQMDEYKEGLYREIMRANFLGMAGAKELILSLKAAGFNIAVGSSGPRDNVLVAIDGLSLQDIIPVQQRISGSDVSRGKPDPEVFLKAAASIGLPPACCVVIEDAPVGLQAARSAGAKCVGLASTGRTRSELSQADLVIDALSELTPEILQRLIDGK